MDVIVGYLGLLEGCQEDHLDRRAGAYWTLGLLLVRPRDREVENP